MNEQVTDLTTAVPTGTALVAIPTGDALTAMFAKRENVDSILSAIEEAARAEVVGLSVDTKKGRDAIKSAAFKVARSKTALDDAGKGLTEDWRKQTATVNAERNRITEFLDKVKANIRKPVDDWEAAEEKRIEALKARLEALESVSVPFDATAEEIAGELDKVEATSIDDSWQEYLPMAAKAKDAVIADLRPKLAAARQREAEQAELARLREEAQRREAEEAERRAEAERIEREKREAEDLARRQKDRADSLVAHIEECGRGMIGGDLQPWGILLYELERKVPAEIDDRLGDHRERVQTTLDATLADVRALFEQSEREAEEKRKAEADEAAAKAAAAAKEKAEREAAELAEFERREALNREERIKEEAEQQVVRARQEAADLEAKRRAAEDRRRADEQHRARITREIAEGIAALLDSEIALTVGNTIAEAIVAGMVPHVEARL